MKLKFIILLCLISELVYGQQNDTAAGPTQLPEKQQPNNQDELEMVLIITKHGEKGVEFSYPNDPYLNNKKIWSNGLDHLTQKGKQDSFALGRTIRDKYGKYFKGDSNNIFAVSDDSPYANETINTIYNGIFSKTVNTFSSHPDLAHQFALYGPNDCLVLNRRFKRALKTNEVKQLFNDNKELIQNLTGSRRNDQKLIKNIPAVYESIQTELNNYLQQPDWLDEKAINKLNEITTKLDKIYYTNEQILELESGKLLEEFRTHFIDNVFQRPSDFIPNMRFGYIYIVGSDQFSALLNKFKIYNQRNKWSSAFIIEYTKQANVRIKFYDSSTRKLEDKKFDCDKSELVNQCKLIPFLKSLDRLIPIGLRKSCILPKKRTLQSNYDELFKGKEGLDDSDKLNDDDEDNTGNKKSRREQRKQRRRERIKNFIEKQFGDQLTKYRQIIDWLTDLFENLEKKAKQSAEERNKIRQDHKQSITRSVEELREEYIENRKIQGNQKLTSIKNQMMESIEQTRTKVYEKIEELEFNAQDYLETKFEQLENGFNRNKLKTYLDNLETKFTDQLEEQKSKADLELNRMKDRMSKLFEDKIESTQISKRISEFEEFMNGLDEDKETNELKYDNQRYLMLNNLIQELKEVKSFEFEKLKNDLKNELNNSPLSNSLIKEIEKNHRENANDKFDLNEFKLNLNMNDSKNPNKLLRATNDQPNQEAPAFSGKVFGITVAIVAGTMLLIAIICVIYRRIKGRNGYTRV